MVQNRGDTPPRSPRLEKPKARRKYDAETDGLFGNLIADEAPYSRGTLFRLASWGIAATAALVLAVSISQSPLAARRSDLASTADLARQNQRIQSVADSVASENRRLTSATETLQGDRDRLYARVTSLEQTLTALQTASLTVAPAPETKPAKQEVAAAPADTTTSVQAPTAKADPAPAKPQVAAVATADPVVTGSIDKTAAPTDSRKLLPELAAERPVETPVRKTEFGIDLGTASSIAGLRALWSSMKQSNGALIGSLQPIVVIRERTNGLGMQLRLVAGPLTDAAAAAKLCAALAIRNNECDTAVYDGQRLSMQGETKADTKAAALTGDANDKAKSQPPQAAPSKARIVKRRPVTAPVRRPPTSSFGFR